MSGASDSDEVPFGLNPSLDVDLLIAVRRKDQPILRLNLEIPEQRRLACWLVPALLENEGAEPGPLPIDLLQPARELGLLIPAGEETAEDVRYCCDLDDELLASLSSLLPPSTTAPLELNPKHWVQVNATLPAELEGRVYVPNDDDKILAEPQPDLPLLWFEDPATALLVGVTLGGRLGPALRSLVLEGRAPEDLPDEARRALALARILIPKGGLDVLTADREAELARARSQLQQKKYAILRNLVNPIELAALRRYFRRAKREGFFEASRAHGHERDGLYCEVRSRDLQHRLTPLIERVTAEPSKPSFTWIVTYLPNAMLHRHTDREQCRWNVSLCIDAAPEPKLEESWPLCFGVDSEVHEARLAPGDAVIYSGTDTPHWRPRASDGVSYSFCFFHYVDTHFCGHLG